MPMKQLTPMLSVADVQRSAAFYRDKLGFEVKHHLTLNDGTWYWCSLKRDGVELMLNSPDDAPPRQHPDPTVYYIYCPDSVDALHEELTNKGVEASDITVRFYGMKEFHVTDPDGHHLCFGQETDEPSEETPPQ